MDNRKKEKGDINLLSLKLFLFLILFFFILIILTNFISAIQIEMKDEYSQGETLIAKISGNFVDALGSSNILFYRDYVRVPTIFTLTKLNDDYYLYAVLSNKAAGNYSLQIQNVKYKIATEIKDENVIKNFTITNNTADFYVVPGFLKTDEDFYLELTNLKDNKIEVEISFENNSNSNKGFFASLFGTDVTTKKINLSSGETEKVNFEFDDSLNESNLRTINLKSDNISYSVLVYLEVENKTKENKIGKLEFEPQILNVSLATNSNTTRVLYLSNKEEFHVENISVYVSESLKPYIDLSLDNIDKIDENSTFRLELSVYSGKEEGDIEGEVIAEYENETGKLFVSSEVLLKFIKDYVPEKNDIIVIDTKTCGQLNGAICNATIQTCSGEERYAQDGKCCLEKCETKQEGKSSSWGYVGWGLVAVVVAFIAWFFLKKYRRVKPSVDLMKIASGKI